ncbi:MAG: hypothetical protein P9L88_00275 [Candidatus Tantalella remota]|nr:hypothetical protein [Candidatus Tantalella remota]
MKHLSAYISIVLLTALSVSSCASSIPASLVGINIRDLESARADGRIETVSLSYNDAYNKVMDIIKDNKLVVFRSSKKAKYIVFIGLPNQTNTTRVGVFFESISDNNTEITVSSLSDTALEKAAAIIFGQI